MDTFWGYLGYEKKNEQQELEDADDAMSSGWMYTGGSTMGGPPMGGPPMGGPPMGGPPMGGPSKAKENEKQGFLSKIMGTKKESDAEYYARMDRGAKEREAEQARKTKAGTKKESDAEYYARMDRERKEREAEQARKTKAERDQKDAQRKMDEERRKRADEERKKERERVEAQLAKESEERKERMRLDLEKQLKLQQMAGEKQLEDLRKQREEEDRRARDEQNAENERRRKEELLREQEQRELREAADRAVAKQREQQLAWIEDQNAKAASALSAATTAAAEKAHAQTQQLVAAFAVETEAQRALLAGAAQLERELEEKARIEKTKTMELVHAVDASMARTEQELKLQNELRIAESQAREAERAQAEAAAQEALDLVREREQAESKIANERYDEEMADLRAKAAIVEEQKKGEMEQIRYDHEMEMERIEKEARAAAAEMNARMREQQAERRAQWNAMMQAFANMIRNQRACQLNKENERMWDERFNQLRRAFDPAFEVFTELQLTAIEHKELEKSLIQVEGLLESFSITLDTINGIVLGERDQVEDWKSQQPDAHFLHDYGLAIEGILGRMAGVYEEAFRVRAQVDSHRGRVGASLEIVLELHHLEARMTDLRTAFDAIPTVYDLNKRYASQTRMETTF